MYPKEKKLNFDNDIYISDEENSDEQTDYYSDDDIYHYKWMNIFILIIWVLSLLIYYFSET
jgi:hypothetical protein